MGTDSAPARPAAAARDRAGRGAYARLHEQPWWLEALHLAGLWTLAAAQPLFDLLARGPEFFVAHDTRPGDLAGLTVLLCLAGPACALPALRIGRLLGPGAHAAAAGAAVGALVAAVALAAVKQAADWDTYASFAAAAVCGAVFAGGYVRVAAVRSFATLLSPAAVVAPAVFLAQPTIAPLLSSPGAVPLETAAPERPAPVVVVVFDQLPLVSLLDGDGGLDRALYPHFAALADEATWFRNASAVSGWTAAALPAILDGDYPRPGRLPTVDDHPANLFTLLGPHYDLHVAEPLTDLCPAALCPPERAGAAAWYAAVLADLTVVYLHAVLPDALAADLPPVTQNWRDFVAEEENEDEVARRWNARRRQDRGRTAAEFIDAIGPIAGGGRPPLHFLHTLLPHEPWVHLPTGQRHSLRPRNVGSVREHWRDDAWAVTNEYQRHLLQVQFADRVLGDLLQRLRAAGLYGDALVVVTADHGASLRPGRPFRLPTEETFAEIAAVPLIVKRPGQRQGRVSAANVETIDVLPTVAGEIGLPLPRATDGSNVFSADRSPRPEKTMFLPGEADRLHAPGDLGGLVAEAVAHKLERFESGDPRRPRLGRHDDLVGAAVDALASDRPAGFGVVVDAAVLLRDLDRDADFVPARITGGLVGLDRDAAAPLLAVAVNGVVEAVTRPYAFRAFGHATPWEATIDPQRFVNGSNAVRVFAVRGGSDGAVRLDEAADAGPGPGSANLAAELAEESHGVTSSGFLPTQSTGRGDLRWTTGEARLSVPIDPRSPPAALTVVVLTTGPQKRLRLAVDECPLFEGSIFGRWERTFPLEGCRLDSSPAVIEVHSNVHLDAGTPGRRLGVAVGAIRFANGERR